MDQLIGRIPRAALVGMAASLFLLAAVAVFLVADRIAGRTVQGIVPGIDSVEFTLQSADGPVSNRDLLGRPVALFFGFTHCPEICPTTLYDLADRIAEIGPAAAGMRVVFVTVDPERDTPELLGEYVGAASDAAIGLSGEPGAVRDVIEAFRIYTRKVPLGEGDFTFDHTASVFLYDAAGAFRGTIAWGEHPDNAREKLRRLVAG